MKRDEAQSHPTALRPTLLALLGSTERQPGPIKLVLLPPVCFPDGLAAYLIKEHGR